MKYIEKVIGPDSSSEAIEEEEGVKAWIVKAPEVGGSAPIAESSNNIIFECSDLRDDIGLMIMKNNNNNNCNDNDNDNALVMNIDIKDFANMFDSLSEYFQQREGIEL